MMHCVSSSVFSDIGKSLAMTEQLAEEQLAQQGSLQQSSSQQSSLQQSS